jgi:hypothetical protein
MIDPQASNNHQDLKWMREHGGGHYGCQYFGIFLKHPPWGCSVGHYDWPYIAWLHFMRTGEHRFFEEGLQMTRHSIDLDQWHFVNDPYHDGLWMWEGAGDEYPEKRPFHVSHNFGSAQCYTHTWSGGYALGYLLTGDQRYYEALLRTLNGSRYFWKQVLEEEEGKETPYDQTRSQGWCILHHLNRYRVTGERKWIEDAYKLFRLSLLPSEYKKSGAWTTSTGEKEADIGVVQTFHIYPIEPCLELHYWASRAGLDVSELTAFLKRWCEYTATKFYAPPAKNADGKYMPWRNEYLLLPEAQADPKQAASLNFNVFSCSAFVYTARLLKEKDAATAERYDRIGRELFRDRYLYGDSGETEDGGPPVGLDPKYRYPIDWLGWWPTHEKCEGWNMRGSQPFLWVLYQETKTTAK